MARVAADCNAGIATHYCESSKIAELETALLNCPDAEEVPEVLNKFNNPSAKPFVLAPQLDQINKCFEAESVEEIIENLKKDGSEWATKTVEVSVFKLFK